MIFFIIMLVALFLLVMALLDIWRKTMPSILPTTIILFIVMVVIRENPLNLVFGLAGFVFAWLLYEFDFFRGMADLKTLIIISLMLSSLNQFYLFMILTAFFGLLYQVFILKISKIKTNEEISFIPPFLLVYVVLMILIYII